MKCVSKILVTSSALLACSCVWAYQFEFLGAKDPVHQDMSSRALLCAAARPTRQARCADYDETTGNAVAVAQDLASITPEEIRSAVIWADDPVRELRLYKPHRIALWLFRLAVNKCADLQDGLANGLRCSSHYGPLQFMHAMESSAGVDPNITRAKILDWIHYAYSIASNQPSQTNGVLFKNLKTCEARHYPHGYSEDFAVLMFPIPDEFPCDPSEPLTQSNPWRLQTIFSFSCSNFLSANCASRLDSEWDSRRVRLNALGAILHVIQDSYAQGHALRGAGSARLDTYLCEPITQFQDYSLQNDDAHARADVMPSPLESCASGNAIHDPVSASAEIIRMFAAAAAPHEVVDYLAAHVFVLAANAQVSGVAELFKQPASRR